MKIKFQQEIVIASLLAVVFTFAFGCARMTKTAGFEQAEKTTTSMQDVDSDLKQASLQIDAVKASLDDLVKTGQSAAAQPEDVKTANRRFSENADQMEKISKKLNKDIDEMAAQRNTYLEQWAKEGGTYTNPQIQQASQERRARLGNAFQNMDSATGGLRANLNSYMSELKQIQTYLSNDLTAQSIAAIAPIAKNVEREGNKLKQSLAPVETAIKQARADLIPGTSGTAAGGGADPQQQQQLQQQQQPQQQQQMQQPQQQSDPAGYR